MTRENLGTVWQLDHIKALGLFDLQDPEQFRRACHYMNHQPLFINAHQLKTANDMKLISQRKLAA